MWASRQEVEHLREDVVRLSRRVNELEELVRQVARGAGLEWRPPEAGRFARAAGGAVTIDDANGPVTGADPGLHRCQGCGWLHRGEKA